ncbi:unnamed protein product [Schistosoma turkestanicum]|nr:unnamed protein product [Schistosoma turkestanicum]
MLFPSLSYFYYVPVLSIIKRVAQNWVNRACENSQIDGLDEANFRILSAIESVTQIHTRRRRGTDSNDENNERDVDDDDDDDDNDNDNDLESDSSSSSSNNSTNSSQPNRSRNGIDIVRSVLMLGRRRGINGAEQRSEETLASRDRAEGPNEHSSSDECGISSRISSFLAKELRYPHDSSSDSETSTTTTTTSTSSSSSSTSSSSSPSHSSSSSSSSTSSPS